MPRSDGFTRKNVRDALNLFLADLGRRKLTDLPILNGLNLHMKQDLRMVLVRRLGVWIRHDGRFMALPDKQRFSKTWLAAAIDDLTADRSIIAQRIPVFNTAGQRELANLRNMLRSRLGIYQGDRPITAKVQ